MLIMVLIEEIETQQSQIKDLLDLYDIGDGQVTQLTETLRFADKHLAEMVSQRDELNEAIADLEQQMRHGEQLLADRTRQAS